MQTSAQFKYEVGHHFLFMDWSHGIGQKNRIQEMKEVVIRYSLDTILNSNEWEGLNSEDIEGLPADDACALIQKLTSTSSN